MGIVLTNLFCLCINCCFVYSSEQLWGGLKYKVIKDQDQVINKFEEIKAKLQTLGLMADTLGEIYENIKIMKFGMKQN